MTSLIFFYLVLVLFGIILPMLLLLFVVFGFLGDLMGAPFVPTYNRFVEGILKEAKLKKGQTFLELGSGDGRVVRAAVKEYRVRGIGVEINPLLVLYSSLASRLSHLDNIFFKRENFFNTDIAGAEVIFLFLLPKTLQELRVKLFAECRKNTLIISHGFKVAGWEGYLHYKIDRPLFPTYYYLIKKQ